MIARTWGGKVPLKNAPDFHQHLLNTGVRDYERQSGCREIKILRRDADDWAHFLLFSVWQSWDAIRAYAGETPEKAVLYPDDERFCLVPDLAVSHYEIAFPTLPAVMASDDHKSGDEMPRQSYDSKHLATPVGPFSHACHTSGLIFLSGQVGQHPETGKLVGGGVTEQAHQILVNLRSLLEELDLALVNICKVNIFLIDMGEFTDVNAVYTQHFSPPYPARTTVAVKALPLGAAVEMEAVVRKP